MIDAGPSMEEPAGGPAQVGIPAPGFRMPSDTRLGGVRLQVADLERSRRYYGEVVGLRELGADADGVKLGTDEHVLVELREHPSASQVPRRGQLGLYHFALLLPDRPALAAFLIHLGNLGVRAGMSDHSVSEAIYLTDPDGLGIEIYADRPRERWSHHGREIHMTTEPLDVKGLAAAASGPWAGMPAGSVVGHIHLFVGTLEAASDFYHRALGFDRMVWSYPGALFLAAGGYHHHLGVNTWAANADMAGDDDARLLEWRVVVPDHHSLLKAGESLAGAGYEVLWEEREWSALDPWGTRVRVVAGDHPSRSVA